MKTKKRGGEGAPRQPRIPHAGRDEKGRLLPGHHATKGGRKGGPETLRTAFTHAGYTMPQARLLLVKLTMDLAKQGDRESLARLDRWTMPQQRPLAAGLFADAKNALERAAALREALGSGEVAPHEAALVTRTLEHEAAAGEWRETQVALDRIAASPAPALPSVRVVRVDAGHVRVDAGQLPAPRAADVVDVEPTD